MIEKVKKRLDDIDKNINDHHIFEDIKNISHEIFDSLKDLNIIKEIELNPNDIIGGSASFKITTLPDDVFIKLWWDSDVYYMSIFRKLLNTFEQQLTNEKGESLLLLPLKDLDEFEDRILDFVANEIYNRDHKIIIN